MSIPLVLDVDAMYRDWLSGLSIRKISYLYNVGRGRVWKMLTDRYGLDACCLRKQSLARIVYQEYGDVDLAMRARGTEGLYRSQKTMNNYSKNQSGLITEDSFSNDYFMDYVRYNTDDYCDPYDSIEETLLGFPMYLWTAEMTAQILGYMFAHNNMVQLSLRARRSDCRD